MGGNIIHINSKNSGRRRFSKRGNNRLMSEINVTPFVDVMLVLLIIFMVAAPLLTVGVEINLPKTSANALPTEKEQPLTLSITKEKELYLQETKIEFSELIILHIWIAMFSFLLLKKFQCLFIPKKLFSYIGFSTD